MVAKHAMYLPLGLLLSLGLASAAPAADPPDLIARVGDQMITMSQLDSMINSSGVIGMTIPAPGTPERNEARIMLLDRAVSANLIYLDALAKGVADNPVYRHDVEEFCDRTLARLYEDRYLIGDLEVSDAEVQKFFDNNIEPGTELTSDVKLAIEARIRKARFQARKADMRQRLREGIEVTVREKALDPDDDTKRKGETVVATVDGADVTWSEVGAALAIAPTLDKRVEILQRVLDDHLMVNKAKAVGLENDPIYLARTNEFKKVHLTTFYRNQLVGDFVPSKEEVRAYFAANKERITSPEARQIQMVVLKSRDEAEKIKQQIDSGEITIFQAARDHSIDPNAKKTLGEMGWVEKGTGFPELDALTFSLPPDTLGGPVESPAGWHLVKVLEVRPAQNTDVNEAATFKATRRLLMKQRLNDYTTELRKHSFKVEVYQDVINRIMQEEAGTPSDELGGVPLPIVSKAHTGQTKTRTTLPPLMNLARDESDS
jgi:peptidyl-prolyl cis-trans isomerase C